jgi:ABC-type multidrug transport system ATPase subunit
MLELEEVSLTVGKTVDSKRLLDDISVRFPTSHFAAVIGPSGCGKTTLLKLIAGIAKGQETGIVRWLGRDLSDEDFHASEIAYVPQFGIAHEELTAQECVEFSIGLRDAGIGKSRNHAVDVLLDEVGLTNNSGQLVRTLSGGQRRRLALAMELASRPHVLLCDEVTTGLDPQAEEEIVDLIFQLSRHEGRLVISVTHSLAHLDRYDSVLVLLEGSLAFCGSPAALPGYFGIEQPGQLFERLREHPARSWGDAWRESREQLEVEVAQADEMSADLPQPHKANTPPTSARLPHPLSQFVTLFARRCRIFSRSRFQVFLHISLIMGFPMLVAIFAWGGLPDVINLNMGLSDDLSRTFDERREFLEHASEVGSVVSGIVMFQVVLLCLLGANNSGREIASERAIFEKERLAGLCPFAYVASKAAFLSLFVLLQSFWMGAFVKLVCGIPGDFLAQLLFLFLVNGAVTAICLGISSLMDSAEHASLASIYFVGFQLPLSGAVLALPDALGPLVRPFISAYWSWSGFLQTLQEERHYDIVQSVAQSPLAPGMVSAVVLFLHIAVGLTAAWIGCERHRSL